MGLADLVYPGALHTRFHHAIGAMHLMGRALDNLRSKGIEITNEEYEAAQIAVLLHDIGHGPFSHALEFSLLAGVNHESISYLFMKYFHRHFGHSLELTLKMFRNSYERKFFHQLISSQLDMDRLDYINRDSFFTGVLEGKIGLERIINMMTVLDDQVVVEEKGIYSLENFLNARRLMYWQVYLHKTALGAEKMLINMVNRARDLARAGEKVFATPALEVFLKGEIKDLERFQAQDEALESFGTLDDLDVWASVKIWKNHPDKLLSMLSSMLLHRKLFRVSLSNDPVNKDVLQLLREKLLGSFNVLRSDIHYLLSQGFVTNEAYLADKERIIILTKKGKLIDLAQAADLPNIKAMSRIVKKYYLCWPKTVSL